MAVAQEPNRGAPVTGDRLTDDELTEIDHLLAEVRERRADDSKRAWVDAGAPMLGEPPQGGQCVWCGKKLFGRGNDCGNGNCAP